jgi:lipopolysaccharide/colanic/teichoic acid biosynthesis glycosyltransferase
MKAVATDVRTHGQGTRRSLMQRVVKRVFDIGVSSVGLLLLSPLLLIIAVAIRVDSPGPAFFRQERVGLGGRPFRIWKFRSMRTDPGCESVSREVSPEHDPRITRVGTFLRRTFLDELPQLLNVLRGQMSMVGPRPETPKYVAFYTQEELEVLSVKPGIAGPATLGYSADEPALLASRLDPEGYYTQVLLHERLRLDLSYAARSSLAYDLRILAATAWQCLSGALRRKD